MSYYSYKWCTGVGVAGSSTLVCEAAALAFVSTASCCRLTVRSPYRCFSCLNDCKRDILLGCANKSAEGAACWVSAFATVSGTCATCTVSVISAVPKTFAASAGANGGGSAGDGSECGAQLPRVSFVLAPPVCTEGGAGGSLRRC